jgi:hypothetical protein
MLRPAPYLSQKLAQPIPTKDGGTLRTVLFGSFLLATLIAAPSAHAVCRSPKNICKGGNPALQQSPAVPLACYPFSRNSPRRIPDRAALRRDRARPCALAQARTHDGRRRDRDQRAGQGLGLHDAPAEWHGYLEFISPARDRVPQSRLTRPRIPFAGVLERQQAQLSGDPRHI